MKTYEFDATEGIDRAVGGLLERCLREDLFDAVLAPLRSPTGIGYALISEPDLLSDVVIAPPTMDIHGAKAVQSLPPHDSGKRTAVVMRMCEIRAAIELSKLEQTEVGNLFFVSTDCPGVVPLSDDVARSGDWPEGDDVDLRPLCQVCEHFAPMDDENASNVDLHVGTLGVADDHLLLVPASSVGEEVLAQLGVDDAASDDSGGWPAAIAELRRRRVERREELFTDLLNDIRGIDGLETVFERCIECHNCQSVCPICYCRQCFADKGTDADTPAEYLGRAEVTGAVRPVSEPLLFHLGRIAHMSLSCVSCGLCEDVCPVDIPVGQVVSCASRETRRLFDYVAGRSPKEPLPLIRYGLDELTELEDV